jgi:hypothetical protein
MTMYTCNNQNHRVCGLCPSSGIINTKKTKKLYDLSPQANYIDRATAACRRSDCQRLLIEGATWSA